MALLVGDLIDPDPAQALQRVGAGQCVVDHPGHDRPDGAPCDTHQLGDGGLGRCDRQPGDLIIEVTGVPGAMTSPRHRRHHHAMLTARHPRRVGLQHHLHGAQIQRPPPPPTLALVIARSRSLADPAPPPTHPRRAHMRDQDLLVLAELDPLHRRLLDAQQPCPYPCLTHAVPCLLDSLPSTARNLERERRASVGDPQTTHGSVRRAPKLHDQWSVGPYRNTWVASFFAAQTLR